MVLISWPTKLAAAMGWEAGDELHIEVAGKDRLLIRK